MFVPSPQRSVSERIDAALKAAHALHAHTDGVYAAAAEVRSRSGDLRRESRLLRREQADDSGTSPDLGKADPSAHPTS